MRFSAWPGWQNRWDELLAIAVRVEQAGWGGLWLSDHLMPADGDLARPFAESWTTLAALATRVPRIRLGVLVSGNTYRHPAVLAKMATTVDAVSGGRLVLGLGAGWQENEHTAYGIPFFTTGERLRRLGEAARVIRSLFEHERTTFDGRAYRLRDAPLAPKPLPPRRIPLLIGGGGERVTLRIAARYADEWNVGGTPQVLAHKNRLLDEHCAAVGRAPREIARSAYATFVVTNRGAHSPPVERARPPVFAGPAGELRAVVERYREAGVEELVMSPPYLGDAERELRALDRFAEQVMPAFR